MNSTLVYFNSQNVPALKKFQKVNKTYVKEGMFVVSYETASGHEFFAVPVSRVVEVTSTSKSQKAF